MSSKHFLVFFLGVILLITLNFAASSPIPNNNYKNVVEKSHVDEIPTSFDLSVAKLSQLDPIEPDHDFDYDPDPPQPQITTKNYKSVFEKLHKMLLGIELTFYIFPFF